MATKASVTLKGQKWHFVENAALREILERDYAELRQLLETGTHKSAVVLSGSIVEAALVAKLQPRQAEAEARYRQLNNKDERLDKWDLGDIVRIAADLKIVEDKTLAGTANALRGYRNLVHPMLEYRLQAKVDADMVDKAVSLLKSVLKSLAVEDGTPEERFLQRLRNECGQPALEVGETIIAWATEAGLQPNYTPALQFQPRLLYKGKWARPIAFRTSGHINIMFKHLKTAKTPFRFRANRHVLAERLNKIPGVKIRPADEVLHPAVHLRLIQAPSARQQFFDALTWAVMQINPPMS